MIITRAPMRISLFGGGSDLPAYRELTGSGGCVLSCTIDQYVTARWVEGQPVASSQIAPGSGLGGSGAMCVAMTKLQTGAHGHDLFHRAWQQETALSPYAGWQDVAAATFGGLTLYDYADDLLVDPLPIPVGLRERLLLFKVGSPRPADPILAQQAVAMRRHLHALADMATMAQDAAAQLSIGCVAHLGALLHEAWRFKRTFAGVETDAVTDAYQAARKAGASGGKLCGAGGSGYLLLYAEPDAQASVRRALLGLGLDELRFSLTTTGAEVVL